jgi:predicted  nucleic acid-binding Zn-ribbon protein
MEDSVLKSMTEIEAVQAQLDAKKDGHAALKQRYDEAYEEWQHSLSDLREETQTLRHKIEEMELMLPPAVRSMFQKTLKQRQNVAVARVMNGDTCGSCRSRIRPALFQQLKRGELVHCEGCYRILYLENPSS